MPLPSSPEAGFFNARLGLTELDFMPHPRHRAPYPPGLASCVRESVRFRLLVYSLVGRSSRPRAGVMRVPILSGCGEGKRSCPWLPACGRTNVAIACTSPPVLPDTASCKADAKKKTPPAHRHANSTLTICQEELPRLKSNWARRDARPAPIIETREILDTRPEKRRWPEVLCSCLLCLPCTCARD